jgi:two-component system, OmpR family, phosphate regulon sensor histidine kinase PhoR
LGIGLGLGLAIDNPGDAVVGLCVLALALALLVGLLATRLRRGGGGRRAAEREAEPSKDDLLTLVSHELGGPLTSIIGYTELISEQEGDRLSEQGRDYLDIVDRNAAREMQLMADFLCLLRIDQGTFAVGRETVDLGRIVERSVEAARPSAKQRGVVLAGATDETLRCVGDPERLAQVVDNLLSNAIKFTPKGGRVAIRLAARDGTAEIEVEDTGMGIPSADRERVFDRLYRAPGATAARIPGLGLGLTTVKAIVGAHHGAVSLESQEEVGTTVRVTLPLEGAPE